MGPETELGPRKGCSEGWDSGKRSSKGKPPRKDDTLNLKDLREIGFGRYGSSSCKNVPSRFVGVEGNVELKRGSIYQSSGEVSKMKRRVSLEGRRRSEVAFSSRAVEANTYVKNRAGRSTLLSRNSDSKTNPAGKSCIESCSSDDYFEICLDSNIGEQCSSEDNNFRRNKKTVGPRKSGNELLGKTSHFTLHKSLSAKVGIQQLPSVPEGDHSSRTSSRARFSPIRKMFDPFMKSKSMRSSLSDTMEACKVKGSGCGTADGKKNKTSWKSMLDDFSKPAKPEATLDRQHSLVAGSPVHLHGSLKLENKDGMPFFEFSLKCPEEVFVAKTWKSDNAVNWVYTFHSIESRKKSNASARGSNYSNKESSMVGQMQVSCYICSELRHDGVLDNSVATEFVLYDIVRARKSVAQELSISSPDVTETAGESLRSLTLYPAKVAEDRETDSSYLYPWAPAFLHPSLEIAATVIQVPFKKKEIFKHNRRDKNSEALLKTEQKGTTAIENTSHGKVKVVIPSGNHGLRSDETQCPSSLLDRWRLGGRCDCGGWDMACPLLVFGNHDLPSAEDRLFMVNHNPLELFVQGSKEDTPALTITSINEGEYAVDFHAQLSTLQAFSICVAILHSNQPSTCVGNDKNMQLPQCRSLKTLLEEEVKILIEAVTEGDKRKLTKTRKEIPASFVLNPPFSSNIARV